MKTFKKILTANVSTLIAISILLMPFSELLANDTAINNLKNAIEGRENVISDIDKEIRQLESQLSETRDERLTLQETVEAIASQQDILQRKINLAENSIEQVEGLINQLDLQIELMEDDIADKRVALKNNFQRMQIVGGDSLIEGLLKYESLAQYWQQEDVSQQLGSAIGQSMSEINEARRELDLDKARQVQERNRIESLQQQVLVDKQSVDIARAEQDRLLDITRNEESTYQEILAEKRRARDQFEADIAQFQAQLQIVLNPESIPTPASSVLSWPVDNVRITQYFGNTAFAQSGAYNGSGHNGVDFGIPVGTPVKSARQGIVKATGNTDNQCPYASYGKWVLVEHDNGLSTLYAHLSNIAVSSGQSVSNGQVIGYSGNTGYSTGPHLHFTVYASDGVRVDGLPSRSCPGTNIILPLADLSAYLNPLDYLP